MTSFLRTSLAGVLDNFRRPRKRSQVAALCYRKTAKGGKQILLITSRDQGRWIIPKGWPIEGLNDARAAKQEAWEEAGVSDGKVANQPIGTFDYQKRLNGGGEATCETQVFPLEVAKLAEKFPEASQRTRKWFSPKKAAQLVDEPELKDILRDF